MFGLLGCTGRDFESVIRVLRTANPFFFYVSSVFQAAREKDT